MTRFDRTPPRLTALLALVSLLNLQDVAASSFDCQTPARRSELRSESGRKVGDLEIYFRRDPQTNQDEAVVDIHFLRQQVEPTDCVVQAVDVIHVAFDQGVPIRGEESGWTCHEQLAAPDTPPTDLRVVCAHPGPEPLAWGTDVPVAAAATVICSDAQLAAAHTTCGAGGTCGSLEPAPYTDAAYFVETYCRAPGDGIWFGDVPGAAPDTPHYADAPPADPGPDATEALPAFTAALRAPDGVHFVTAKYAGHVKADVTLVQDWERLSFASLDGGPIVDGALVQVGTFHGTYLTARYDGSLDSNVRHVRDWEHFVVEKLGGSPGDAVLPGDQIALRSFHGTYVSASLAGGDDVRADGPRVDAWERFTLVPVSP